MEEYGLEEPSQRKAVYGEWQKLSEDGLAADTFWQIAVPCKDMDNFGLCPDADDFKTLVGDHAAKMAAKVNDSDIKL